MMTIDIEQEEDRRWIAEVTAVPGVLAYGETAAEARSRAAALACRVIADLIEHGEPVPANACSVGFDPRTHAATPEDVG